MKAEKRYILELCKFRNANKDTLLRMMERELDYPYILGHLLYNRVGGIAYFTLMNANLLSSVNREFRNALRSIYENNCAKAQSFRMAMMDISEVCHSLSCQYALLKGACLVDLYPQGLRTSNDIDFLVHPKDITELCSALKRAGFSQGFINNEMFIPASRREIISSRMNRGETVPFVKKVDYPHMEYMEIDINYSLDYKPETDLRVLCDFLEGVEPNLCNGLKSLNRVDFLLHLCAHLYKEATVFWWVQRGRDISLYKYCDLYLLIMDFFDLNFATQLLRRTISLELQPVVYYALHYTKEIFQITNDALDYLLAEIQPSNMDFLREIIDPSTGKNYRFDKEYIDWVFCSRRKGELYET